MSIHDGGQRGLDFFQGKKVVVEVDQQMLTSDAGLLVVREFEERIKLTERFAQRLDEIRSQPKHSILQMVRSRVFGILAGYEDQNDHDALRSDPVFKLLAGCSPDDEDLASQPTLSRFENAITPNMLLRLEQFFIEEFAGAWEQVPRRLTLDVDVFDDPTHGQQQLTFFHGFYRQYQYLVRVITCAENDQVLLPALLHGTARAGLGAADELQRVMQTLRARQPDVQVHLRADSGYAGPEFYDACEALDIVYTVGMAMNPRLQCASAQCLQKAEDLYSQTGTPQRLFTTFEYQAESWSQSRWVVVKCEVNAQGTNRRAVVTNRAGASVCPQGIYEDYAGRGESENRNKELKRDLCADRLSDHRYMANCFRMFLHCLSHNLLVRLRQSLPTPALPPVPVPAEDTPPELSRRRQFNARRRADPLGEGQACTWRMLLIKVAARITVSRRRVWVRLSSCWPNLCYFQTVLSAISALPLLPEPSD